MKIIFMFLVCLIPASESTARFSCGDCPRGWTFWRNNCYRFFNNRDSTWEDAETFCREYSLSDRKQSHLVTIDSQEENDFILDWWRSMRTTVQRVSLWLGYTDKDSETVFVGSNGACPKFTKWDTGEPNDSTGEDCVTMWSTPENGDNGSWNDISCTLMRPFICKLTYGIPQESGGC